MSDSQEPGPSRGRVVKSKQYEQDVKRYRTKGTAFDIRFEDVEENDDVHALARNAIQVCLFSLSLLYT